jgi:hypothetical protein
MKTVLSLIISSACQLCFATGGSIGSGPVTSVPANEPFLAFVVEVTSSTPFLLMSEIDWGITQPNVTFTGTFSPDQGTYGGTGIGWTTGAGGTKTFTSDANTPVNGIILGGVGFNMNDASPDSSASDPFYVTALYTLNGAGGGAGLTVPFELADAVPEPSAFWLLAMGISARIFFKNQIVRPRAEPCS